MKKSCKAKVLDALEKVTPEEITRDSMRYKDEKGLVCFNGMIAEICSGTKLETPVGHDHYYQIAGNISEMVNQMFFGEGTDFNTKDEEYEEYLGDFEYEEDAENMTYTLEEFPQHSINRIHEKYCRGDLTFTEAINAVKRVINLQ